jgi:hypothetical protein
MRRRGRRRYRTGSKGYLKNGGVLDLNGGAAFHGGVYRITQKDLYVRTTIAMAPFHHFPIDAPPWKASLPYGFKGIPQEWRRS